MNGATMSTPSAEEVRDKAGLATSMEGSIKVQKSKRFSNRGPNSGVGMSTPKPYNHQALELVLIEITAEFRVHCV